MSSGTFSYPLGFAAILAVIGWMLPSAKGEGEQVRVPQAASDGIAAEMVGKEAVKAPKLDEEVASGVELCRLGDAYKDQRRLDEALDSYQKAVWTESPDDVIQYALDSATAIMLGNKDWKGIAKLHRDFIERNPKSQLLAVSVAWLVKAARNEGDQGEAAETLAAILKTSMSDPSNDHIEAAIDEFVKSLVPRRKSEDLDADALDKQLVEMLENAVGPNPNATATARMYYARARLACLVKRADRSELYLKGIALSNLKDPSVLSPALLTASGETLLKLGNPDGAETMFWYLKDHHAAAFGNEGSIGLGNVALARHKPEEALKHFNKVLANKSAPPETTAATLGKLRALDDLHQDDEAVKLVLDPLSNKVFMGESAARAYLILGGLYERKAIGADDGGREFLEKALGCYQRVVVAYQGYPELSGEASRRADELRKKL